MVGWSGRSILFGGCCYLFPPCCRTTPLHCLCKRSNARCDITHPLQQSHHSACQLSISHPQTLGGFNHFSIACPQKQGISGRRPVPNVALRSLRKAAFKWFMGRLGQRSPLQLVPISHKPCIWGFTLHRYSHKKIRNGSMVGRLGLSFLFGGCCFVVTLCCHTHYTTPSGKWSNVGCDITHPCASVYLTHSRCCNPSAIPPDPTAPKPDIPLHLPPCLRLCVPPRCCPAASPLYPPPPNQQRLAM